ncbi:MAG TPA: phosphate ABC transporter permease PstA [Actinomycetota bacterium]|nr:phosphate ABC transporter permease PstA [Actinomycetota bacterium]
MAVRIETLTRRRSWTTRFGDRLAEASLLAATAVGLIALTVLLWTVLDQGATALNWPFIRNFASRIPERAGIWPPLVGTVYLMLLVTAASFPLGVGAAIYLEEFAPRNRLTSAIETNIANLAAVPSIIYGLLGLALFYRAMNLGRSLLTGALTLTLLVLPVIIIATREALRAVPHSIRLGAMALGATRWEAVYKQVLPIAIPGIMTGTILGLSRAIGETAPLLVAGAAAFVAFTPDHLLDAYSALPIQIFDWVRRPQPDFQALAAGAILVLLALLLTMNAIAIVIRNRYYRRNR